MRLRAVPYSHSCSIPKAVSAVAFSHRCSILARRRCALIDDLLRPGDGARSGDGARARHHTVDAKKRELFSRATQKVSPPSKAWPCLSRQQQNRKGPQPKRFSRNFRGLRNLSRTKQIGLCKTLETARRSPGAATSSLVKFTGWDGRWADLTSNRYVKFKK